jgi:hypothetical protein
MKHYSFHTAIIAAVLLTSAGCSHEEIFDRNSPGEKLEGRVITLTASMPEEPSATRLTLTPGAEEYPNINLAWEDGDEVQFCLVQGATKVKQIVTVEESSISNNGKTAQFSILLDDLSDAPFDIYGIYGGELQSDPAKAYIPASTPKELAEVTPVLTLSQTEVNPSSPAINAPFVHLGSLLCVSVQNTGTTPFDPSANDFVLEGLTTNKWAVYGDATFDITAGAASFADEDKESTVTFSSNESNLTQSQTTQLWTWIVPTGDYTGYLELTQGQNESSNVLHGRSIPEAGKAYYINVEWDGTNFSFDGGVKFTPIEDFEITDGVLTKYNGSGGVIILPPEVTSIADGANVNVGVFKDNKTITKVYLNNVTEVGKYAFKACTGITEVDAPNVETVDSEGFHGATHLAEFNFPKLRSIGDHAFQNCDALKTVSLAEKLEFTTQNAGSYAPGQNAFKHCDILETINLSNVEVITAGMFESCGKLTTINAPNVKTLGAAAFNGCTLLTTIDLPKLTTFTGIAAFQGTGLVEIDLSGITELTQTPNVGNLLRNCTKLKKVNLSNLKTMASSGTFLGCTALEEVDLSSLEVMTGTNLFADNTTTVCVLPRVALPSIKEIGANAFYRVTNMIVDLHDATELSTVAANAFPDVAGIKIYVATPEIANLFSSYTNIPVTVGAPQP